MGPLTGAGFPFFLYMVRFRIHIRGRFSVNLVYISYNLGYLSGRKSGGQLKTTCRLWTVGWGINSHISILAAPSISLYIHTQQRYGWYREGWPHTGTLSFVLSGPFFSLTCMYDKMKNGLVMNKFFIWINLNNFINI